MEGGGIASSRGRGGAERRKGAVVEDLPSERYVEGGVVVLVVWVIALRESGREIEAGFIVGA